MMQRNRRGRGTRLLSHTYFVNWGTEEERECVSQHQKKKKEKEKVRFTTAVEPEYETVAET